MRGIVKLSVIVVVSGLVANTAASAQRTPSGRAPPAADPRRSEVCPDKLQPRLVKVIAEQLGYAQDQIKMTARFVQDLGADSLDLVELVMAVEQEFAIEIADNDAAKIKTVGEALAYLGSRLRCGA